MFLPPFQDLRFDGNRLARVPTEVLAGPEALQNLQLQDNIIGEREEREMQGWTKRLFPGSVIVR